MIFFFAECRLPCSIVRCNYHMSMMVHATGKHMSVYARCSHFCIIIPVISVMMSACAAEKPKSSHNWSTYEHYEDNDASYVPPEGFGFCGGEMAICE